MNDLHPISCGDDWLRVLGVVGIPVSAQEAMLSSLVLGQTCLLVGPQGCCKTTMAALVARELGLKCTVIDVSKACFEDLVGLFNPRSLAEGKLDYIPTTYSIYETEFLVLDDYSRMQPHLSNKYMEITRNRTLLGRALPRLAHCWASMNPAGTGEFVGTFALDRAALSRFIICIQIPSIGEMKDEDVLDTITTAIDPADAPLLEYEFQDSSPKSDLQHVVADARQVFWQIWEEEHVKWALYLKHLRAALIASLGGGPDVSSRIDGRGLVGLLKTIIARRSLEEAKHPDAVGDEVEYVGRLVQHSFGLLRFLDGAGSQVLPLESAHYLAVQESGLRSGSPEKGSASLKFQYIPIERIPHEIRHLKCPVDPISEGIIARRLSQALESPKDTQEIGHALASLTGLLAFSEPDGSESGLHSKLVTMETCYLQENPAATSALIDALSLDPEALADRHLLLTLTYLSNRELKYIASRSVPGRRGPTLNYARFLKAVRTDAAKWLRDIDTASASLKMDLDRLESSDGSGEPFEQVPF